MHVADLEMLMCNIEKLLLLKTEINEYKLRKRDKGEMKKGLVAR